MRGSTRGVGDIAEDIQQQADQVKICHSVPNITGSRAAAWRRSPQPRPLSENMTSISSEPVKNMLIRWPKPAITSSMALRNTWRYRIFSHQPFGAGGGDVLLADLVEERVFGQHGQGGEAADHRRQHRQR